MNTKNACYRKVGVIEQIAYIVLVWLKTFCRRELIQNKVHAALLLMIGAVPCFLEHDATFFVMAAFIAVPMFFSKENWIL